MNVKAEIIAIGTELLIGHVVNTNATYLSEELNALGISTYFHTTVGDNPERIQACLRLATERSDLILCTGGLGPTADDITHEVIASFINKPLVEGEGLRQVLIDKFRDMSRALPEINFRQVLIPEGSTIIPNPTGTAVGIILRYGNSIIISFPGVPSEMKNMFQDTVKPFLVEELKKQGVSAIIASRKLKFFNIGESRMAEILGEEMFFRTNPSVAPYASLGECYVRVTAKAASKEDADRLMQPVISEIEEKMQGYLYAYDEETIPSKLAKLLVEKKMTIAFAESCTGGLLAKTMTDIPGASAYLKLSLLTYANEAKEELLGVRKETLEKYGAVSRETAREMVLGLAKISNSELNVSITGIAGPDGGSPEKPVGTIFIGILLRKSHPDTGMVQELLEVKQLDWSARKLNREQVRELAMLKTLYEVQKILEAIQEDL